MQQMCEKLLAQSLASGRVSRSEANRLPLCGLLGLYSVPVVIKLL